MNNQGSGKRWVWGGLLLAGVSLLAACGGSSGGGGGSSATDLNGAAVKGILKGADVAIYKIESGAVAMGPLAEAVTGSDGKYAINLGYSGPALIRVSGNDDARMTCDIAQGCDDGEGGTAPFGADVPFDASQALEAVVVLTGSTVSVNVTPLTHLAASKTQAALAESANLDVAAAIASNNSQVANLFGLSGSLTGLPVVDITDPLALAAADPVAQRAALVAAGIYSSALADGMTLDDVANNFVVNGGQLLGNDVASFYQAAGDILALPEFDNTDLSGVSSALSSAQIEAENLGDQLTDAQPSPDAQSPDLLKAKSFVTQVRTLGTTFVTEESVNAFADELKAAEVLLADEAGGLFDVLGRVADALAQVHESVLADEGPESFPVTVNGVEVNSSDNGISYTVTHVAGAEAELNISVTPGYTMSVDETEDEGIYTVDEAFTINFSMSGQMASANLLLDIREGKAVGSATYNEVETWDGSAGDAGERNEHLKASVKLDLDVELKALDDSVALAGKLSAEINGFDEIFEDVWDETGYEGRRETTFNVASLTFNGNVSTPTNTAEVILSFNAKSNGYVLVEEDKYDWEQGIYEPWDVVSEETSAKFVEGSFSLIATATLNTVGESKIEISGTRSALNAGNASVKITYPVGKSLTISAPLTRNSDGDVPPPKVTIVNQDGVTATLEVDQNGDIFGNIKVGSTQYAEITEPNVILVRFSDGAIESLQ
ncbi:MAG: hypothetical protein ACK4SX_08240 [Alcanivoracaceae bacterium]